MNLTKLNKFLVSAKLFLNSSIKMNRVTGQWKAAVGSPSTKRLLRQHLQYRSEYADHHFCDFSRIPVYENYEFRANRDQDTNERRRGPVGRPSEMFVGAGSGVARRESLALSGWQFGFGVMSQ